MRRQRLLNPAAATVAALVALAALLRFYAIGRQGLWYDESYTALLVRRPLGVMLGLIPRTESTPPLYYCAAWVWSRLFGDTAAGLRSLSALAGVLVVPIAYLSARKLASPRAGLIAAALAACNPFLIWYSQEARSYESLVLLAGCSLLAFAYALERPSRRRLAAWTVTAGLAMATHYYAVLVVVPEAVILLASNRRRLAVWVAVAATGACGLALVPLILAQSATGNANWIATAPLGLRLAQILPQFLIGTDMPHRQAFKLVAFALGLTGLALLVSQPRGAERREALIGAEIALGGFAVALLTILAGSDTLITRNIIELWLPAAVAIAAGLAAARGRVARAAAAMVTGGLCAIGVIATIAIATNYNLQRPNWQPVAAALGPPPAGGARLILDQHYAYRLPLALYLPHLLLQSRTTPAQNIRQIDVIGVSSPGQPLCWWGAACNLIPSRVQRHYRIPGFRIVWRRRIERFTVLQLGAARPVTVTPQMWARVLSSTTLPRDVLLRQP